MQDSKLLVAGTISGQNNAITGFNLATAGVTTTGVTQAPYSVDLNPGHQSGVDFGEGTPLYLKYLITATITGASGLTVSIIADSAAAMNSGSGGAPLATLASQNVSALTAGTFGYFQLPPQIGLTGYEFLSAGFEALGSAVTAGSIVAEFTNVIDDPKKFYASGFTVV
ncbi:MAG: hypothetical protein ABSB19_17335 [Methylomonas sp.]|jgi:hypothetical protein